MTLCAICERPVDPDDAHDFHDHPCADAEDGWPCTCDYLVHPACCPTCPIPGQEVLL